MGKTKWKQVGIPEDMWKMINKFIKAHPELGYKSIADFVHSSIRLEIDYRLKLLQYMETQEK